MTKAQRQAIARIIDPAAFPTAGCTILSDKLGKLADNLGIRSPATLAMDKADAIIALILPGDALPDAIERLAHQKEPT